MEEIQLADKVEVNPAAGVTYAWRDLNVHAGGGNMIRKRPKAHILKNGELQIVYFGVLLLLHHCIVTILAAFPQLMRVKSSHLVKSYKNSPRGGRIFVIYTLRNDDQLLLILFYLAPHKPSSYFSSYRITVGTRCSIILRGWPCTLLLCNYKDLFIAHSIEKTGHELMIKKSLRAHSKVLSIGLAQVDHFSPSAVFPPSLII